MQTLISIGSVYRDISRYSKSLEYLMKSLEIARKFDLDRQICEALDDIGVVYSELGRYDMALKYYIESIEETNKRFWPWEHLSDKNTARRNIGLIYIKLAQFEKALKYFDLCG